MNADLERDVRAALQEVAGLLTPPPLNLDGIRRAVRRRRRVAAAAGTAAAVAVVGIVAAVLPLSAPSGRPSGPAVSPSPATTTPPAPGLAAALANVQAFYAEYDVARQHGPAARASLVRARMASWYAPIAVAATASSPDLGCGIAGRPSGIRYASVGLVGGQAVIVLSGPRGAAQTLGSVVTADPSSGKITGITCTLSGAGTVTAAGAENAARSVYEVYLAARHAGAGPAEAISRLTFTGPETGNAYLTRLQQAARAELGYDPVLCTANGIPSVSVGRATIVASGVAALVTVSSGRESILVSIELGARGWAVFGISCARP